MTHKSFISNIQKHKGLLCQAEFWNALTQCQIVAYGLTHAYFKCVQYLEIKDSLSFGLMGKKKVWSQHLWWSWGCGSFHGRSNVHICNGTLNAERYKVDFEQYVLPFRWLLVSEMSRLIPAGQWSHILLSADMRLQSRPVPQWNVWCIIKLRPLNSESHISHQAQDRIPLKNFNS